MVRAPELNWSTLATTLNESESLGSQSQKTVEDGEERDTFSVSDGETTRIMQDIQVNGIELQSERQSSNARDTFSSSDGEDSREMEKIRLNSGIHAKIYTMILEALQS